MIEALPMGGEPGRIGATLTPTLVRDSNHLQSSGFPRPRSKREQLSTHRQPHHWACSPHEGAHERMKCVAPCVLHHVKIYKNLKFLNFTTN